MNLSDPAAERAVIAGIYQHKDIFLDICENISVNSFTTDLNQIIFTCLAHILHNDAGTKLDMHLILSAANELKIIGQLENEPAYLQKALNLTVEASTVIKSAKRLQKLQIARELDNEVRIIRDDLKKIDGSESISQILGLAENRILDFSNSLSGNNEQSIIDVGEKIEEYVQFLYDNPTKIVGVSTGYPIFDKLVGGGLRKKTVSFLCSRPAIGKTSLGVNIATHITQNLKNKVLILNNEMSEQDYYIKLLSMISGITIDKIESGEFRQSENWTNKVKNAAAKIKANSLQYVNVAGKDFSEIIAIARRWLIKNVGFDSNGFTNDACIIYDYLKLQNSEELNGNLAEYQILGFQTTQLSNFAQKYNIPILSFLQLNRDSLRKNTSDVIAGSDRILWLASTLGIFKEKTLEEMDNDGIESGNRKLYLIKTRYGQGLDENVYINMNFNKKIAKITEGKLSTEVYKQKKQNKGFELTENINETNKKCE